ncbi:MAG: Homoserine dehydrogenase [Verrucomicrobia bacterium ADurb.Bin345]|nr:MAG: Homoserine dehydrogenase [Verrucomicrobia bacterium ADurb.Bin345]
MPMKEIGIGLLGFGTVGAGVVEGLQENGDLLAGRVGARLALRKVADIDLERDRGVKVDRAILTKDAFAVVRDPSVDVVVELIGGCSIAKELILEALKLGKPVVTANKALLAEHGAELYRAAEKSGAGLYCEASVGGGIPVIKALREGLVGNEIQSICGILNGTCNYILTEMERERIPFRKALKDAQEKGYAEAEPSLDIDGIDTAHKAVVLASLAYGFAVPMKSVHVEGIRSIDQVDILNAENMGYRVKLLALIKRVDGEVEVRVNPTLVPLDHMLASVNGVFNAIQISGDIVGDTLYYGRGAGRAATSSAVLSDLADVARALVGGKACARAMVRADAQGRLRSMDEIESRYYLRLMLLDKPGMLARVAHILGENQISIASVMQPEARKGEHVPVVIVTHDAKEKNFRAALQEIDALDVVSAKTVRLRIEDFR